MREIEFPSEMASIFSASGSAASGGSPRNISRILRPETAVRNHQNSNLKRSKASAPSAWWTTIVNFVVINYRRLALSTICTTGLIDNLKSRFIWRACNPDIKRELPEMNGIRDSETVFSIGTGWASPNYQSYSKRFLIRHAVYGQHRGRKKVKNIFPWVFCCFLTDDNVLYESMYFQVV